LQHQIFALINRREGGVAAFTAECNPAPGVSSPITLFGRRAPPPTCTRCVSVRPGNAIASAAKSLTTSMVSKPSSRRVASIEKVHS
jgi:hypothetical protein